MASTAVAATMSAKRLSIAQLLTLLCVVVSTSLADRRLRVPELLGRLPETPSELGQTGRAEQEHDDQEDDGEFGRSEIQSAEPFPRWWELHEATPTTRFLASLRSEERRVGKESRGRR